MSCFFRVLLLLSVPCLAAVTAGAASAQQPVLREQIYLAVWHDGTRDDLKGMGSILSAAQRQRPGLMVNLRVLPTAGAYRQLQEWTAPGARNVPDVVILRDLWLPEFSPFLQPLNALLPARALAQTPASVRERLRHAGNLYGVPWQVDAKALFYRPDVLAGAGVLPPRTWEETLIAARRCHNPPQVYGFGLPGIRDAAGPELLLQMLWAQGTDIPPVGRPEALCPEALATALRLYADLHRVAVPEVLSWDQAALEEFFIQGKLAMLVSHRSFQEDLAAAGGDLRWETTPLPSAVRPAGFMDVQLACVLRESPNHQAAVTLLQSIASEAGCEARVSMGSVPFRTDVASRHRLDPAQAAYIATLEHARGLPAQRWPSARLVLSEALFLMLTGRHTVEQAVSMVVEGFTGSDPLEGRGVEDGPGE